MTLHGFSTAFAAIRFFLSNFADKFWRGGAMFFGTVAKFGSPRRLILAILLCVSIIGAPRAQENVLALDNENVEQTQSLFFDNSHTHAFARILLRNRPFVIAQSALYEPLYTGVIPPSPNNPPITEQQGAQMLVEYANQDPFADPQGVLAAYNNPAMRAKSSHPSIGVAIASLQGTPGGAEAIDFLINQSNSLGFPRVAFVSYADAPLPNGVVMLALYNSATQQSAYVIDPQLIRENPLSFRPQIKHEVVHQDAIVGRYEEEFAYTFQALDAQLLLQHHPNLASLNTRNTFSNRIYAAALSNSRPLAGNQAAMGMLSESNQRIFPGTLATGTNFNQFIAVGSNTPSPGNAEMGVYEREFLGSNGCSTQEFKAAQFQCLDQAVAAASMRKTSLFSPANRVRQALALRLNIFTGIGSNLTGDELNDEPPPAKLSARQIERLLKSHSKQPAAPFAAESSLRDLLKNPDWQIVHHCRSVLYADID
jgi:hypothetical protein